MNCTKYLHKSVLVYNETRQEWDNETSPDFGNTREEVFDTAEWISYSLAPSSRYCFTTNLEIVMYIKQKMA